MHLQLDKFCVYKELKLESDEETNNYTVYRLLRSTEQLKYYRNQIIFISKYRRKIVIIKYNIIK